MKIVSLKSENVKRLSAVEIKPDGSIVVIGGRNGQGKSSVLDSIMYALGGGESLPSKPLRNGANKGQVRVDLGDLVVTRKFSRKTDGDVSSTLEVKRSNGDRPTSPQTILDQLCGKMAFDPLEFARLKPKAQLEALKELVNLDFASLDRERQKAFDERTSVNRQARAKAAELEACPKVKAPDNPVSVSELMDDLKRRQAHNQANDDKRNAFDREISSHYQLEASAKLAQKEVDKLQHELDKARIALELAKKTLRDHSSRLDSIRAEIESLNDIDTEPVETNIAEAESVNENVRQNQKHAALSQECSALESAAEKLTAEIQSIDERKAKAMAEAPFPVAGLGFDSDGVTLNGLPFDQASSAERLRVSVAMGLALNTTLRVMLIRDGSLLDEDSLSLVAQMAEEADAQIWVERVGEGEEVSVIIEDGHVKAEELATA